MPRQFIGVGGTGQHVALALARAMFVGAIPPGDARCTIIDADDQNPLASKLRTFANFAAADQPQFAHPFGAQRPAVHFIKPFADEAVSGDSSFETMLMTGSAGGADSIDRDVIRARITGASSLEALADVDLAIEAARTTLRAMRRARKTAAPR